MDGNGVYVATATDPGYSIVTKVPYAVAMIPASSSLLVEEIVRLIDLSWKNVYSGNQFTTSGFQKMANLSLDIISSSKLRDTDANATEANFYTNEYLRKCVINKALMIPADKGLIFSPKVGFPSMYDATTLGIQNDKVSFNSYKNPIGTSTTEITCGQFYQNYFKHYSPTVINDSKAYLQSTHPHMTFGSILYAAYNNQIGNINGKSTSSASASTLIPS